MVDRLKSVLSEFFIDTAKVVFGTLVIGAFIPRLQGPFPWLSLAVGTVVTILFIIFASYFRNESRKA